MKKYYIYLTPKERNLIMVSLIATKNKLLSVGKFTDGIDETLTKISRVRLKKVRVI